MQKIFVLIFKMVRRSFMMFANVIDLVLCRILFYGQNVRCESFTTQGLPYVSVALGGSCRIGKNFNMINKLAANPMGPKKPCVLFVDKGAQLTIGDNVGMSQVALICHLSITIGNNVMIGGGVSIYDTDFHSLDANIRRQPGADMENKTKRPVIIKNNAFVGAHATILKGVTIGENAIIGACSLVSKDVPDNQIWAGNPAKMVKILDV